MNSVVLLSDTSQSARRSDAAPAQKSPRANPSSSSPAAITLSPVTHPLNATSSAGSFRW